MKRRYISVKLFAGFFTIVNCFGCTPTAEKKRDLEVVSPEAQADATVPVPEIKFLALGGPSHSKTMQSLVTIYKHRSDPQPTCTGCIRLRLVIDDRDKPIEGAQPEAAASPIPHSAMFNTTSQCQGGTPGLEPMIKAPFSSIWRYQWSPRETQVALQFDPAVCKGNAVALEFYADTCQTQSVECSKQIVKYNFSIPVATLKALSLWMDDQLPNRIEENKSQ